MATIAAKIRNFLGTRIGRPELIEALGDDDSLIDGGVLDSLGALELAGFVESEFGFPVDEVELVADNFETVSATVRYIRSKTSDPAAQA